MVAHTRGPSERNSEGFFCAWQGLHRIEGNLGQVEEFYCGNSTNNPRLCKEAENAPGTASTCVGTTRPSDLLVGSDCNIVLRKPCFSPPFHLKHQLASRPCRLTSPVSDAPFLSTPGGPSRPIWSAFEHKILPTTDLQDPLCGVHTMPHPPGRTQWANL